MNKEIYSILSKIFNDIFDINTDSINQPNRSLVLYPYLKNYFIIIGAIFLIFALILSFFLNLTSNLIVLSSIPILILYTPILKKMMFFGNIIIAFFLGILINFISNYLQEIIIGKVGEKVLIDLRRSMFEHLQRVSLSFMDKTEVGRMMSRLQGDVAALQEFLHTITIGIGDLLLISGIVFALFFLFSFVDISDLTSYEFIKSNKDIILKYKQDQFSFFLIINKNEVVIALLKSMNHP